MVSQERCCYLLQPILLIFIKDANNFGSSSLAQKKKMKKKKDKKKRKKKNKKKNKKKKKKAREVKQ